jgi:hypothetical protein
VSAFKTELISLGNECLKIFHEHDLADEMFYYKSRGVPGFVRSLSQRRITEPNSYVREIMNDPPKWSSKELAPQLQEAIMGGLEQNIRKAILYYDKEIVKFNSAREILQNIYALGILSDVLFHIRSLAASENTFLLSDAGEFLSMIIEGDQTPFIYEKIGNRYENYMIDEFQDTSIMQWNNFFPLIYESLAVVMIILLWEMLNNQYTGSGTATGRSWGKFLTGRYLKKGSGAYLLILIFEAVQI